MRALQTLLGIELPVIQAPMAGVQDNRLTVAVSNAGGHIRTGTANCAGGKASSHCGRWHRGCQRYFCCYGAWRCRRTDWNSLYALPRSHHKRATSGCAEKCGCPPHRAHQPFHWPSCARNHEPHHEGTWPDQQRYASVSVGHVRYCSIAKAESQGSDDFSPLWAGQNASGCKEISAGDLTREFAAGVEQ
jgi:hypothetical protein